VLDDEKIKIGMLPTEPALQNSELVYEKEHNEYNCKHVLERIEWDIQKNHQEQIVKRYEKREKNNINIKYR
jgi:hypothetical protein